MTIIATDTISSALSVIQCYGALTVNLDTSWKNNLADKLQAHSVSPASAS